MIFNLSSVRSPRNVESATRLSRPASKRLREAGFTLLECFVALGIIAALGGMLYPVVTGITRKGEQLREVNAGKVLINAYIAHAMDNNSELMIGYYEGKATDLANQSVIMPDGETVRGEALFRYPYRLAKYFDYLIEGTVLINQNRKLIPKLVPPFPSLNYAVSTCPSFGINYYFTGYSADDEVVREEECVRRIQQCPKPGSMLIFATAFQNVGDQRVEGRFGVRPPNYRVALWGENDAASDLDARHNGKVLCAFLDGSVRPHTTTELKDMRYWSPNAQRDDNPDYKVAAQGSGGVGGGSGGRR